LKSHLDISQYLIQKKGRVDQADVDGWTPLILTTPLFFPRRRDSILPQ